MSFLEALRIFLCLACLSYASWSDLKKREVSDLVWIVFIPFILLITIVSFYTLPLSIILISIFSIAGICLLSFILAYTNLFGPADSIALSFIALSFPIYPDSIPFFGKTYHPYFPLSVFSNALIFSCLLFFFFLISKNTLDKIKGMDLFKKVKGKSWEKALAFIIGYRMKLSEIEKRFAYPIEEVVIENDNVIRRLRITFKIEKNAVKMLRQYLKDDEVIWTSLGLPMILFLTIGFIFTLFFGDPLSLFFPI